MASNLQSKTFDLQIDYDKKVVCVPTAALAKDGGGAAASDNAASPSASAKTLPTASGPTAEESRAALTAFLNGDLAQKTVVQADTANGTLNFTADDLFVPGSDALSPKGVTTAASFAQSSPGACTSPSKMAGVNVAGNASFNAFSTEGQHAYDLALRRTVALYKALIRIGPSLGRSRIVRLTGRSPC